MTKKLVSFDDQAEPGQGLPAAVKAELSATYADKAGTGTVMAGLDSGKMDKAAARGLLGATYTDLGQRSGAVLLAAAAGAGTVQQVTLTGNVSVSIPTMPTGTTVTLVVRQDATGGRKVFWPSYVWWDGEPALSSAGGAIDVVTLKSVGAAWTASVEALPANAPQVLASDDFTATDGTALHQRTLPTGGGVWNSPGTSVNDDSMARAGKLAATISTGGVTTSEPTAGAVAWTVVDRRNVRISVDYDFNTSAGTPQARIFMGHSNTQTVVAYVRYKDVHVLSEVFIEAFGVTATFLDWYLPTSGRLAMEVRGDTYTVFVNGKQVGNPWILAGRQGDRKVGFSTFGNASTVENFTVEAIESFAQTRPYPLPTSAPYTVPTYAITPTPDNTGTATHPSVVDFGPDRIWNGHRYWMAMTPYFRSETPRENPAILCSDDGFEWFVPNGLTNPVFPTPVSNDEYFSDTELVYDPDTGGMVMYWRETTYAIPAYATIWASTSNDGVSWTAPVSVASATGLSDPRRLLSPAVVRVGPGDWRMWTDERNTASAVHMRTATGPLGPWSAPQDCTFTGGEGQQAWHHSTEYLDGVFYWIGQITSNLGYYGAVSVDGITWTRGSTFMHKPEAGWSSGYFYRPTMQPHEDGLHWRVWYAAYGPEDWRIGYTQVPRSEWPALP